MPYRKYLQEQYLVLKHPKRNKYTRRLKTPNLSNLYPHLQPSIFHPSSIISSSQCGFGQFLDWLMVRNGEHNVQSLENELENDIMKTQVN